MVPIVSIVLALALPVYAMHRLEVNKPPKHPYLFSITSFVCCGWAIIAELFCVRQRLFSGDIGGIEDTIGAVLVICIGLLIATALLNLLLLGLLDERT